MKRREEERREKERRKKKKEAKKTTHTAAGPSIFEKDWWTEKMRKREYQGMLKKRTMTTLFLE